MTTHNTTDSNEQPKDFDEPHRWEVEPHPWDSDFDIFVTDDDEAAREAILRAAEMHLWDSNDGEERTLRVKMNDKIPNVGNVRRTKKRAFVASLPDEDPCAIAGRHVCGPMDRETAKEQLNVTDETKSD